MTDPTEPNAAPSVAVVQGYLADVEQGNVAGAKARLGSDLVYRVPGRNLLSGVTQGREAPAAWVSAMHEATGGTYRISATMDWLASESRAVLLAHEHGTVNGHDHDWLRAIVFTVDDGLMTEVTIFEDDQYTYDGWLGAGTGTEAVGEPAPAGAPEMSGQLDDPRVRAVLSYQRQVAAGDIENARKIFWPDVVYTVPGHSLLSGVYRGPDEVMGYFGRLFDLTDGSYAISRMHWVTSPTRVGLLTRNHASRGTRSLAWDELIVFTFSAGRKKEIAHFSGDQYGVDELFS